MYIIAFQTASVYSVNQIFFLWYVSIVLILSRTDLIQVSGQLSLGTHFAWIVLLPRVELW